MTDFETRARAAARAVHDAVDAPTDELATRRRDRGPVRAVLIAAAVIVVAAIVGTTLVTREEGAGPASDVTSFCAQVQQMVTTPVDVVNGESTPEPSLEFLRDAPEEIRPTALEILRASATPRRGPVPSDVSYRFLHWWQLRCYPDVATPAGGVDGARWAPVPIPPSFTVCTVGSDRPPTASAWASTYGTITIYGDASLPDPYAGPMIGVIHTKEQSFYDDDTASPIAVAGHPGAELTVATGIQGAPIAGLGSMVSWKGTDGFVAVLGRGYDRADATVLATAAAGVAAPDPASPDGPTVTPDALPSGYEQLFTGPVAQVYPLQAGTIDPTITYDLTMQGARLAGAPADAAAFDTIRFFAPSLAPTAVGTKVAIVGDVALTNSDGSHVRIVRWREGDGTLTMTVGPGGPSAADVTSFVSATRRLDRPQWEQLVGQSHSCGDERATSSGSGSSAATSSAPSSTSTTTPAARP